MKQAPAAATRVAAVMAVYNRRDLTLACLRSLRAQQVPGVTLDAFMLDDASTDGTSEAIAERFPEVTVLHGNGELYWNGGMRRTFAAAVAGDDDYYLWMNDDTRLDDGALALLIDTERQVRGRGDEAVIVAGSTRHPDTGELTYGGVVRPYRWRPLRSELVEPGDTPRPCDTMNANTTLISRAVVQRVGNIDPAFVQQMGDFDHGLGACAAGRSVWVAPGTVGTCALHPERRSDEQPLGEELRRLWSTKELAPGPWAVYSRRWAGRLWPVYWLNPYVRRGVRLAAERTPLRRPPRRGAGEGKGTGRSHG
jgi:GT2 family glycosyltransferase